MVKRGDLPGEIVIVGENGLAIRVERDAVEDGAEVNLAIVDGGDGLVVTAGLNLFAGRDAGSRQFDGRDHVAGGRTLVAVAPGRAFQVGESLIFAVAGDDVFRPIDRIAKADGHEGHIHAAQLAGDGITEAGDEGHGVCGRGAHFFDGGGVGGRDNHFEGQAGGFIQSRRHHLTAGGDDIRIHRRDEEHLDGVFGGSHARRGRLGGGGRDGGGGDGSRWDGGRRHRGRGGAAGGKRQRQGHEQGEQNRKSFSHLILLL